MLGLVVVGYGQERYGSRKTYIAGMISMALTVFLAVFCESMRRGELKYRPELAHVARSRDCHGYPLGNLP